MTSTIPGRIKNIFIFSFIFLFSFSSFSQETSIDKITGNWTNNTTWEDNSAPAISGISTRINIYGYVSAPGLTFNGGKLFVYDTLVIDGDLNFPTPPGPANPDPDIYLGPNAVLIVLGNFTSGNKVNAKNGGSLIITGDFNMSGGQSDFTNDENADVYIFGNVSYNPPLNFTDISCPGPDPYASSGCGYGNSIDITGASIFSFFTGVSCGAIPIEATITGSFEVYNGISYTYTTEENKNNYTWSVVDGTIISGQNTRSITIKWNGSGSPSIQVAYDTSGCCSFSSIHAIKVTDLPIECFSYRRQIAIKPAVVNGGSNLTNFPFLVKIQNSTLRHIYNGGNITHRKGYDILFTENADGTGIVDYQLDYYDPATGTLYAWVKIPDLSASVNTIIYLFYGNYNISSDLSTDAVWANDYVAVYHLGESLRDYGPTENYGINNGTTTTSGKIGLGRDFERDDRDYIFVTNEPEFRFDTTMSFSYWMYIETFPTAGGGPNDWMDVLIKGDNANFRLVCNKVNRYAYYAFGNGGAPDDLTSNPNTVNTGTWIYVAGTWDGKYTPANQRKKLFINNTVRSNDPGGQDLSKDFIYNTHSVLLGINEEAPDTRAFDGILDEVRISRGWRSDGWILTEYNNQNDPSNYIILGGESQIDTLSAIGGDVDVEDATIQARNFTRALVTGYTGNLQWQYSTDNIDFYNITGETNDLLITNPLLETTYFRALVTDAGCSEASTVDSVLIEPGFIDCEYNYRKKLSVNPDHVYGTDDLKNFPLLIKIQENDDLKSVGQGGKVENNLGYDIAFTADNGMTILAHEIEEYDSVNGSLTAWVRVLDLKAEDSTYIYLYYGNPSVVANPSTSVTWSNEYIGVWHMGNDLNDATGNNNDGTNNGTMEITGNIGNARLFDGSSNFITIANEPNFDVPVNGKLTVSGWIYVNSFTEGRQEQFIVKGNDGWFLRKYGISGNQPELYHQYQSSQYLQAYNTDGISSGNWHYLVATFDHTVNNMAVYIDGSAANSTKNDPSGSTITGNNNQVRFGANAGVTPGNWFNGRMDEIRIQNVARTSDWIKTEYLNQSNPANFINILNEEFCTTDPTPGIAASVYSKVCQGESTKIYLSGFDGNIYWQSSPDSLNWKYMTGESDSIVTVGPLTDTMYYRATVSYCCELYSNVVRIDYINAVPPHLSFVLDSVNCPGGNDGAINLTITGGASPFDISWSTGSASEDIFNLEADYYTVTVTDKIGCREIHSVEVIERKYIPLYVGNITGETSSVKCYGYDPAGLNINPSGSTGTYNYQWQSATDGVNWNNIPGATNSTYNPGELNLTTHFRVLVDPTGIPDCDTLTPSANTIVFTILPDFNAGDISGETSSTQCSDYDPSALTVNPSGGAGTYSYQWQSSPNGSDWSDIIGATEATYDPDALTSTTYYRVMVDPTGTPDCREAVSGNDTIIFTIQSFLNVNVSISADQNNICSGTITTFSAVATNGGSSPDFQWKVNGNSVGTNSDTYNYSPADNDSVYVIVTSGETCSINNPDTSNTVKMIVFSDNPASFDVSGSGSYCTSDPGLTVTLSGSEVSVSYQLVKNGVNSGTAILGNGNAIEWENQTEGTYTIVSTNGCDNTTMTGSAIIVESTSAPATYAVSGSGSYCTSDPGLTVTLSGSEVSVSYQLVKNWINSGTAILGDGSALEWENQTAGTYTIVATNGCDNTPMTGSAIIVESSSAPSTYTVSGSGSYCTSDPGLTVTLSGSKVSVSYQLLKNGINSGTAILGNGSALEWENQTEGTYTIVASNGCDNTPMTGSAIIVESSSVPATYTVSGSGSYCTSDPGLTVTLSGSEISVSYQLLKNGINSGTAILGNGNALEWENQTEGTYTIVASNGCDNTPMTGSAIIVESSSAPSTYTVSGSGSYCTSDPGLTVILSGSEVSVSYQLLKNGINSGTAILGNGNALEWENQTEGTYTIVASNGCDNTPMTGSAVIVGSTSAPAKFTISGSGSYCTSDPGLTVTLSGSEVSVSYQLVKDGVNSGITVPGNGSALEWDNQTAGTYTIVASNGCGNTPMTGNAVIVESASAPATYTVSGSGSYCTSDPGLTVTLSGSEVSVSYQLLKDGINSGIAVHGNGGALEWNDQTAGTYSVVASNGCGNTPMTGNAVIVESASAPATYTISGSGSYCTSDPGLTVTLSGSEVSVNYQLRKDGMNFGTAIPGNGNALEWNGQTAGTYNIVASNGCGNILMTGSAVIVESASAPATYTVSGSGSYCITDPGLIVTLSGSEVSVSYQLVKDGVNSGIAVPGNGSFLEWNNQTAGTYTVVASNGCGNTPMTGGAVITEIDCNLNAQFIADHTDVCPGTIVTFTDQSQGTSLNTVYNWEFGSDATPRTATGKGPHLVSYSTSGSKSVSLEITDGTTSDIYEEIDYIHVYDVPLFSISESSRCGAGEVEFNVVSSDAVNVDFSGDGGNTVLYSDNTSPFSYRTAISENELITVMVRATNIYGCTSAWEESEAVTAYELPGIFLGNDTMLCGLGAFRFEIMGYSSYLWSNGNTDPYLFVYPGQQTISLTVTDEHNCTATDEINIISCSPLSILGEITNAFTPNNDGNHDKWEINNIHLFPNAKIEVYDRWGRLVYSTNGGYDNVTTVWDGTSNGKDLPMDTYYYIIDLKESGYEPLNGTVTIVR